MGGEEEGGGHVLRFRGPWLQIHNVNTQIYSYSIQFNSIDLYLCKQISNNLLQLIGCLAKLF